MIFPLEDTLLQLLLHESHVNAKAVRVCAIPSDDDAREWMWFEHRLDRSNR